MLEVEQAETTGAGDVLELLRRQLGMYAQLQALADKQRVLIAQDDPSPLLNVLATRRRVTVELERLNERLAGYRRDWAAVRARLSAPERDAAEGMIAEVGRRLQALLAGDEEDMRRLAVRKQRVAGQMNGIQSGRAALQVYGANVRNDTAPRLDSTHEEA